MSNQLQTNLDTILQDKNTNLLPENLKAGVTCLGVEGTLSKGTDTSDATATADDIVRSKTAYVNGEKITGTIPNNGNLHYDVSTSEQVIPAGYTSGGTIAPSPLTEAEYESCLGLSEQILGENVSL